MKAISSNHTFKWKLPVGLFLIVAFLGSGPAVYAQQGGPPGPPNAEMRAERMKAQIDEVIEKLELDKEKSDTVRTILTEQAEKQGDLFASYAGQGREAMQMMREEMQEIEAATKERLKTVLSEEQLTTYEKLQAEMRERRRGQFGGGRRGPGGIN